MVAVRYRVEIRPVAGGPWREIPGPWEPLDHTADDDDDWPPFIWTEGNFGCDCNRRLLYDRAADLEEEGNPRCGDGAYRVRLTSADGQRVEV